MRRRLRVRWVALVLAVVAVPVAAGPAMGKGGPQARPAVDGGAPLHLVGPDRGRRAVTVPPAVLAAYLQAARVLAVTQPVCHLPWELLAAIGEIESDHAFGGDLTPDGRTRRPILGPVLNGSHGRAAVRNPDGSWARARGPMQFLPATWAVWGVDADGDGLADPDDVNDAALTAADYLCAGSRALDSTADLRRAVYSYNPSPAYLADVMGWVRRYRSLPLPATAGSRKSPGRH
jgi:membrane-bound lytic murein transglycosylase B